MSATDKSYTDPMLAQVYDALNPWSDDQEFYASLAGSTPKRILDVGCGTGHFAAVMAQRGHVVTGADPADAMLSIARNRPGGHLVNWINLPAHKIDIKCKFDLIIMSGHAFQVFLTDQDVCLALQSFQAHLAPDGVLAFDTRNPARESWRGWVPDESREIVEVPGVGPVKVFNDLVSGDRNRVTYQTHFTFPDGQSHIGTGTLRFLEREELVAFLDQAGFAPPTLYGDWNRSAVTESSKEIIVVAELQTDQMNA